MKELKELFFNPVYLIIILLICAIYTFLAFKYANRKKVAAYLEKIFLIILLIALTGVTIFPFSHLHPSALADVGKTISSAIAQLGIYASIVFILNSRFRHFFHNTAFLFRNPFLVLLLCLTVFSASWSETPAVTLKYSIVLLGISALAAHVGRQYSWQELTSLLRWSNTLIALVSVLVALLVPSIGLHPDDQRWVGIMGHPISLGNLMALNTVLWYSHATQKPKHRWMALGLAVISLIVMLFAKSAGAFFTFFVVISMLLLLRFIKRLSITQAFITIIFFIIVGTGATILIMENLERILNVFGKELTLTGRTEFWPKVVEAITQRPLLGYGYKGFWQPWRGISNPAAFITTNEDWEAPHSHNGFLDLTIDLGLVGLILFVLSFLKNIAHGVLYYSRSRLSESTLPLILLIFLVMKNLSENGFWGITLDFFLYVLVTVRLSIDTLGEDTHFIPSPKRALNTESYR